MKHTAHVTLRNGSIVTVEVDACDRRTAALAAIRCTSGAVSALARPVDQTSYVRALLAERMSGFPIIGTAS